MSDRDTMLKYIELKLRRGDLHAVRDAASDVEIMELEDKVTELQRALRELLEQIDMLDDVTLTRDIEPYKAQACWDDAVDRARKAIK